LKISKGELIEEVNHFLNYGIETYQNKAIDQENDNFVTIRYHLVLGGAKRHTEWKSKELLKTALNEPSSEVKAFANEILNNGKVRY